MDILYEDKTEANVKIIKVDRMQNIIEYTQKDKSRWLEMCHFCCILRVNWIFSQIM